ncbi:recombinase family protein [Promicromonospora sp. CA-289599]|uniref:recombinase family protein n=1 Tax=Promicromonospora sp. CA-289599 TaxID=3240014 RepID=UPI003D903D93
MNLNQVQRCVLYARLSVTKEESVSIARQLESGRKYAEARGWEVVGEFVDDGVSAMANRPEDRKGWAALLAADDFDAVVIWKVDRLARRVLDFLHADESLQARRAGLVAVEDPIDMTSPQGRAFAVMLAVFGEMEAEGIRARVRAARAHLIKDGRFVGGGIPYGYRSTQNLDGPGRILTKDAERIRWLGEAVRLAQQGGTVNAIAIWLTDQGAPLPVRRKPRIDPENTAWNRQTVEQLLRNPVLAGMTPHNPGRAKSDKRADPFAVVRDEHGAPVIDESLAIITFEEFVQLQRTLDTRDSPQARKRTERQTTSPFLSRVALCDDCDVFLYRGTNQKQPVLYCPKCRQTLGRVRLDLYLTGRLLAERGTESCAGSTVRERWKLAGDDEMARRAVLMSQLDILRVRRGVVGRYFDADRLVLQWRPTTVPAG